MGILQARILEWVAMPSSREDPGRTHFSDPGIEPGSPALQADSLPSEPHKPFLVVTCVKETGCPHPKQSGCISSHWVAHTIPLKIGTSDILKYDCLTKCSTYLMHCSVYMQELRCLLCLSIYNCLCRDKFKKKIFIYFGCAEFSFWLMGVFLSSLQHFKS